MDRTLKLTNTYWDLLKSLSNEVKLRLATRLTASVTASKANEKDRTERMIEKYCGSWKGECSAESIIKEIKNSRATAKEPLKFDL